MDLDLEARFGVNLRAHRQAAEMTQAELGRQAGALLGTTIGDTMVAKIERGVRGVKLNEAAAFAKVLGLPLSVLTAKDGGEDDPELLALEVEYDRVSVRRDAVAAELEELDERLSRLGGEIRRAHNRDLLDDLRSKQL